nr:hypothetical protein [Tanacetum cinerariifolium]
VPTASEEGCYCHKRREATAKKIVLLSKSRRNCQSKSNDSFTRLCPSFAKKTYSSSLNDSFDLVPIASPSLLLFHNDPYMKVMHAYYAKESPIPPPTIVPPSPIFNSQEFFLLEELLPPKKHGRDQSSSSTPTLPQEFKIGESSHNIEGLGKGRVIIQQDFDNLETELQVTRAQVAKLQRKQLGQNNKISLARFMISNLEQTLKDIQARHPADKESLLEAIYELKINKEGPSN